MKSSIQLFGYCELEQEKNFIIDNQETLIDYIDSLDAFYSNNNFQYIKHDLEIVIKIQDAQVDLTNNLINYCKIKNDEDEYPVYYFVTKIQAAAENTNRIYLKMDTLTTFFTQGRMTLNDKTKVLRQHKDRFFQKASGQLQRKVDNISEGVQPIQFKQTESKIEDDNSNIPLDWYLMYKTKNSLNVNDIANPLSCYLLPSTRINMNVAGNSSTTLDVNDFDEGFTYISLINDDNDGGFSFKSTRYYFGQTGIGTTEFDDYTLKGLSILRRGSNLQVRLLGNSSNNDSSDMYILLVSSDVQSITFYRSFKQLYKTSGSITNAELGTLKYIKLTGTPIALGTQGTSILIGIDEVDKTDTRIMKIIKLPYSPTDVTKTLSTFTYDTNIWEYELGMLKLKNLDTSFVHCIKVLNIPNLYLSRPNTNNQTARLPLYESKLYSSDYFTYKIGYDSFTKAIDYERLLEGASSIALYYKMTNTFNSKMLFWLRLDEYKSIEDYELYLPLARNNEISIYSNDFLNYIRTGYNYDKKTLERQSINNIISTAGGVVGGIASAVAGGPIGWATAISIGVSTLTRLVTSINQQVQNEQTLESKLKQLSLQSSSVSGSDDVDLMSYYTGNRAVVMTYSVSEEMKKALYDLFYYCGYARNFNETIDIYSRKNFNFLQCEAVWDKYAYIPNDWVEDMNQRLLAGVTIFHYNNGFDFNQEYENWEVWL